VLTLLKFLSAHTQRACDAEVVQDGRMEPVSQIP
jgi:hypothetical protein